MQHRFKGIQLRSSSGLQVVRPATMAEPAVPWASGTYCLFNDWVMEYDQRPIRGIDFRRSAFLHLLQTQLGMSAMGGVWVHQSLRLRARRFPHPAWPRRSRKEHEDATAWALVCQKGSCTASLLQPRAHTTQLCCSMQKLSVQRQ